MAAGYSDYSSEFTSGNDPECENNSDKKYEEESDQSVARRTTSAARNVPVPEMSTSGMSNASTSEKPIAVVPKKRRYVATDVERDSAEETSTLGRSVSTIEDPVEEVNRVLSIEKSRKKPKAAIEKARKTVTWATDAPPVKKIHRDVKKQPRKAKPKDKPPLAKGHRDGKNQPRKVKPINELPLEQRHQGVKKLPKNVLASQSTSLAVEEKDECVTVIPQMDAPRSNKIPSKKDYQRRKMWEDTMASDFNTLDYEKLLKKSQFTDLQTDLLKRSFNLLCRKLHIASTCTDRCMKTHACTECHFCISHECPLVDFSQSMRSNAQVMGTTTIAPESMNICSCGFGFIHSHSNKPRDKLTDNLSSINILRLLEHERSMKMSCPNCHMNIVMKNKNMEICSNYTSLGDSEGFTRDKFHCFLKDRLKFSEMSQPQKNEMYTCSRRCCHVFHRCPENTVCDNTDVTQIYPITTYTSAVIVRSKD